MASRRSPSSKIVTGLLLAISIIVNIGGVLQLFGIVGSFRLGIITIVFGVALVIITFLAKSIYDTYNKVSSIVRLVRLSSIDTHDLRESKNIYILGSGTETYYGLIHSLLTSNKLRNGITIHIGVRIGNTEQRFAKLIEYEQKWKLLASEHNLKIIYYPYQDFFASFRGIVVDQEIGLIGFYHRIKGHTTGYDKLNMLVKSESEVGKYLIDNFRLVFDTLTPSDNITGSLPRQPLVP